jgi:hypothetical protein
MSYARLKVRSSERPKLGKLPTLKRADGCPISLADLATGPKPPALFSAGKSSWDFDSFSAQPELPTLPEGHTELASPAEGSD